MVRHPGGFAHEKKWTARYSDSFNRNRFVGLGNAGAGPLGAFVASSMEGVGPALHITTRFFVLLPMNANLSRPLGLLDPTARL
jgi:hypothetical protein